MVSVGRKANENSKPDHHSRVQAGEGKKKPKKTGKGKGLTGECPAKGNYCYQNTDFCRTRG